jgi:hypothetical protein
LFTGAQSETKAMQIEEKNLQSNCWYTRQNPYNQHSKEAQIQGGDSIQVTNMNTRASKDGSGVLLTRDDT